MGHLGSDCEGEAAIGGIRWTGEAAGTRAKGNAMVIDHQHFGILLREPRRGRRGRCAEKYGYLMGMQNTNDTLEPVKSEAAFLRLHQCPGKLGDAHVGDARACHRGGVLFPEALRSLVRVVVGSEQEWQLAGNPRQGNSFLLKLREGHRVFHSQQTGQAGAT